MEVDTAVRHAAKAVFIVSSNAALNIERHDQETNHGGRVVGTTLRHADYAAMARALASAPALIDVVTSQRVVSPDANKGLGFVPPYQALTAWDDAERKRRET